MKRAASRVDVALPLPIDRTFTYEVDGDVPPPGTRVLVPFQRNERVGWVLGPGEAGPIKGLRSVLAVLDERPTVPKDLIELSRWMADYYVAPLGIVLRTILPAVLSDASRDYVELAREPLGALKPREQRLVDELKRRAGPARVRALRRTLGKGSIWPEIRSLHAAGVLTHATLPPAAPSIKKHRVVRIARELGTLAERDEVFGRAGRQREAYALLEASGGTARLSHLTEGEGFSRLVIRGLEEKGLVCLADQEELRDPFENIEPGPALRHQPSEHQRAALDVLVAALDRPKPEPFLLRGITGSGKTLVYIELLREALARGRSAIVLVPEISLTPQTVSRFRAHFGDQVAVMHSGLSDGERYDAWRRLRNGDRRIAVGARSALFAPLTALGVVVVDEEHDGSYKQSEAPRYHARDLAVMRALAHGAVCVLGSATPSLESWHNARSGKFTELVLPERVGGARLPVVRVVDLREARKRRGDAGAGRPGGSTAAGAAEASGSAPTGPTAEASAPVAASPTANASASADAAPAADASAIARAASAAGVPAGEASTATEPFAPADGRARRAGGRAREPWDSILSADLVQAIDVRLRREEQVILLLNRRGYSSFIQCRECGEVEQCRNCSISLTYHRVTRRLACHHCRFEAPAPSRCPRCGSQDLSYRGPGTEQVERVTAEAFPSARIARMDVDTTSGKWAHQRILERVERREVDVLLGTQMIAKGLDFPGVTLVGVINADIGIHLPDFRASERAFQLLSQVAGRAGRGPRGGEVIIQTSLPEHYAVRAAVAHDYLAFAERELAERRQPAYPPHLRLANVVVSSPEQRLAADAAQRAAAWLGHRLPAGGPVELIGPAPAPIERLHSRWRWHFLLRSASPRALAVAVRDLMTDFRPPAGDVRVSLDRDPVAVL